MKPGVIKPKTARFVVGALGVALSAGMAALMAASGALDWRAAALAAGTALVAWVQKQPWADVLQELLDTLPDEVRESVRATVDSVRPPEPPTDGTSNS